MTGPLSNDDVTAAPTRVIHAESGASLLEIDESFLQEEYRRAGAILLRGFDYDVETFKRFAERLCSASVFNESRNRAVIDRASNIQSVDLGNAPFPLHPELSREPWRPDVCLFACFSPPSRGGETTICDGVEIVRRLPPELVDEMLQRRLLYCQPALPHALEFWLGTSTPTEEQLASPPPRCPYSFSKVGEQIVRCFSRPFLHKPMFDDRPAFGNFLLFARLALRVSHFPVLDDGQPVPDGWVDLIQQAAGPITYPLEWRQGDLLILDNSRFMHGRNQIFNAAERKIASYFGYLNFAPPNGDDPPDAPWRRGGFRPPAPPTPPRARAGVSLARG